MLARAEFPETKDRAQATVVHEMVHTAGSKKAGNLMLRIGALYAELAVWRRAGAGRGELDSLERQIALLKQQLDAI